MADEAVQSNDEQQASERDREARLRQLFAEAQEMVAAADFVAAAARLRMIPPKNRTPDVERLDEIVKGRVAEIATLREEIQRDVEKNKWKKLGPKLERLLELQPGDERANEWRHELEEREWQAAHPRALPDEPVPLPDPEALPDVVEVPPKRVIPKVPAVKPVIDDYEDYDADYEDYDDYEPEPAKPPVIVPVQQTAPADVKDEADEQLEEIWEFGDRLDNAPPPLPAARAPIYVDDDDEIDLVPMNDSSTGIWIAVMVSSLVVLVAVVTTIVVLAQTTK